MDDKNLLNKKVSVYYNDSSSSVSKLVGIVYHKDDTFIALQIGDLLRWIPIRKIVRVEELNEVENVNNKKN